MCISSRIPPPGEKYRDVHGDTAPWGYSLLLPGRKYQHKGYLTTLTNTPKCDNSRTRIFSWGKIIKIAFVFSYLPCLAFFYCNRRPSQAKVEQFWCHRRPPQSTTLDKVWTREKDPRLASTKALSRYWLHLNFKKFLAIN